MDVDDDHPRPTKRQKLDTGVHSIVNAEYSLPSPLTLSSLLLLLPALLLHPPTHPNHIPSLALSFHALKKCTSIENLYKVIECRALTGLAELGLQFGSYASTVIQAEIQKTITKSSLIAQNLPSLHLYRNQLAQLSCRLSLHSGNAKVAQNTLKRILNSLSPNEPPHVIYSTHLSLIASLNAQASDGLPNHMRCLDAINTLQQLAKQNCHKPIVQLASVLRLHALIQASLWGDIGESLEAAEVLLQMADTLKAYANERQYKSTDTKNSSATYQPPSLKSSFDSALVVHTLVLGIIFHTYRGDTGFSAVRLRWLHELLDVQLPNFPKTGIFKICFNNATPLYCQLTHPRIIYVLGFFVSSLAKRDLLGRRPKKIVFAIEGLNAVDKELKKEITFPVWASITDVQEVDNRLRKMRADLMCELAGAYIMRGEFEKAERILDELISHARTHEFLSSYMSRITLFEAQLAHASNKPKRALQCYQVAALLSRKKEERITYTNSIDGEYNP